MIRNAHLVEKLELKLARRSKPSYAKNVKIANALLKYAIKMGKFPPKNRMEDIEIDIRYAKAIHEIGRRRSKRR
ncbi:MAG TPA: hypothetical protein VKS81_05935 [Bacteroidota bacterium]|nr:hypothetical protein [Bacteroidota bacterium]